MTIFPATLVGSGSVPSWVRVPGSASPVLGPGPGRSQLKGCVEGPTVLKKGAAMKKIAVVFLMSTASTKYRNLSFEELP